MTPKGEWSLEHLQKLQRALEYHGRLDNRVVDDLADTLGKTPQSIKAKARQLRAKEKSGQALSVDTVPSDKVQIVASHVEPSPPTITETTRKTKRLNTPSYTELISEIENLETLVQKVKMLQAKHEEIARELDEANRQLVQARESFLKRFPEANNLVDRLF